MTNQKPHRRRHVTQNLGVFGPVYTRVRSSHLIGPAAEPGAEALYISAEHPAAQTACSAGCGEVLHGKPTLMLPLTVLPEDHRPTGYSTTVAQLIHVDCLMPQPEPPWVHLVARAQRLAAVAGYGTPDPTQVEKETESLRHALQEALDSLGTELEPGHRTP